jgi:hypothetical protein
VINLAFCFLQIASGPNRKFSREGRPMKHALSRRVGSALALVGLMIAGLAFGQAQQPKPPATSGAAAHYDRMAAAKSVFLKNAGGSDIPFNVISRDFEGWAHYLLVDSPDNADLIIEIQSPDEGSGNKDKDSEKSKTNVYAGSQQKEPPKPPVNAIVFTVYDKNKRPMWIAREEPKYAVKHKTEEAHLEEAAQKIFTRFHDRIEPPAKP